MSDLLPRGVTSVTVRFKRDQQGTNIKPSHGAKASQGNVGVCGRVRRKTDARERELEADRCKQNRYTQTTFIDVDGEECVTKVRTDDHEDERADWNQHQHLDLPPPSSLRSSLCSRSLCPSSLRSSSRPSSLRPSSLRPSSAGTTASHHSPLRVMKSGLKPTSFEIRPRAKTAAPITPAPLVSLSSLHEYEERMREYGHARATIISAVTRVRVNTQVKKSKKHYRADVSGAEMRLVHLPWKHHRGEAKFI